MTRCTKPKPDLYGLTQWEVVTAMTEHVQHERFWPAVHDLAQFPQAIAHEMRHIIRGALPDSVVEKDREAWDRVCELYDQGDWPSWFVKEVEVD